uniref:Uncharacterized protein n=1 Tax=Timema bartmani TaxID=61472 RepID=A0A7R9F030_9NEOP|nr:unnamed protein product [Timema bartmani]
MTVTYYNVDIPDKDEENACEHDPLKPKSNEQIEIEFLQETEFELLPLGARGLKPSLLSKLARVYPGGSKGPEKRRTRRRKGRYSAWRSPCRVYPAF